MRPCPGRSLRCFRRKCRSCPHRRNRPPSGGVLRHTPGRWPAPNRHPCSSAVPRRPNRARGRQGVSGCGPAVRFGRPPVRRGERPAPPYPFRPGRSPVLRPQSVFPGWCPLRLFSRRPVPAAGCLLRTRSAEARNRRPYRVRPYPLFRRAVRLRSAVPLPLP